MYTIEHQLWGTTVTMGVPKNQAEMARNLLAVLEVVPANVGVGQLVALAYKGHDVRIASVDPLRVKTDNRVATICDNCGGLSVRISHSDHDEPFLTMDVSGEPARICQVVANVICRAFGWKPK